MVEQPGTGSPVRIANCSGFYGDRLTAMREMLDGASAAGPVDVLTGDYLAELTMLILGRDRLKDPSLGYARTFVRQLEDCLGDALDRGVRIVSNAGGLNPAGLAEKVRELARGMGLDPVVAHVEGDDLAPRAADLGFPGALTANAYLGGFGIAEALTRGADVVVTGRVTDASLVVGPAMARHGWSPTSYDELAGAVVAGHVVECGTQATGGNFSGFLALPRDARPLGFPIAEVAADGSSVITKHDGTGGAVTVDTVTAQLMYEIQTLVYLNPDATVDMLSIRLEQDGPDRVRILPVSGREPPEQLKVSVNELGGYRNRMEFVLTGLDVDAKAAWVRDQLEARLAAHPPAVVHWALDRRPEPDADTQEAASCLLRVTVQDPSAEPVGRAFSAAAVELALGSYPGFTLTSPPGAATPYGIYRAAYVDRAEVEQVVVIGGERHPVVEERGTSVSKPLEQPVSRQAPERLPQPTKAVPLGTFVHARSGDKGGDANVGLWIGQGDDAGLRERRYAWLRETVTAERIRTLLPEAEGLEVQVVPLIGLGGVNVLISGLLGDGVAASTRFDPQAKALGEFLRQRLVDVPEFLL